MPDDPQLLQRRLDRARQRAADSPPYSPDWDAAMALIEDLERRLAELPEHVDDIGVRVPVAI